MVKSSKKVWWKEAIVYQIYVRSFCDANGDGIGDLEGILGKLDYLEALGINAIYLNPINASPNHDNGYDISDYRAIMPEFGSMETFERLLAACHRRGIRLIMDLVINHTSHLHPWFIEATEAPDSDYRAFYLWHPGKAGGPPNRWGSFFGGSAWTYHPNVGAYYLHLFSKEQPDLNWENESVRQKMHGVIRFYLEKGVDGFRFDAINHLAKDHRYPEGEQKLGEVYTDFIPYVQNLERGHDYIREIAALIKSWDPQIPVIGETGGISYHSVARYTAPARAELDFTFHFDYHSVPRDERTGRIDLKRLKRTIGGWQQVEEHEGWVPLFYSNHDSSRTVSRLGDDGVYHGRSAKMLALLQFTQRGTPFVYYGDEIGMTNAYNYKLEDYNDLSVMQRYKDLVTGGHKSHDDFMADLHEKGRDNARTPMQWSAAAHASFSSVTPWIKLNNRFTTINVKEQQDDPDSIWHFYRRLIAWRKETPALVYGSFFHVNVHHGRVIAYERRHEGKRFLVIANFFGETTRFRLPTRLGAIDAYRPLLSNVAEPCVFQDRVCTLVPYAAYVFERLQ